MDFVEATVQTPSGETVTVRVGMSGDRADMQAEGGVVTSGRYITGLPGGQCRG